MSDNWSQTDITSSSLSTYNLKSYFKEIFQRNSEEALQFVNNENLNFQTLFNLIDSIKEYDLYHDLNPRNQIALCIANEILTPNTSHPFSTDFSSGNIQNAKTVLKWMLETDVDIKQLDDYDRVLDCAAALITKVYKDESCLPLIMNIIFHRHRKGYYINDLVWAFFEAKSPQSLIYIANYLQSSNTEDAKLAQKLLKFIPGFEVNPCNQYQYFLNWLKENTMFLHYTGESFQQSHTPSPYVVVLEGKYLNKFVSLDTGEIIEELTEYEKQLIKEFSTLDSDTKALLSKSSYDLHKKDNHHWHEWINHPISHQIKAVQTRGGDRQ